MISNYTDIENSFKTLENDISKKFNIYNYTLKNYILEQNKKLSYILDEINTLNNKLKEIQEYYELPFYKRIYLKLIKKFKHD